MFRWFVWYDSDKYLKKSKLRTNEIRISNSVSMCCLRIIFDTLEGSVNSFLASHAPLRSCSFSFRCINFPMCISSFIKKALIASSYCTSLALVNHWHQ